MKNSSDLYSALKDTIRGLDSVLVAFSGGTDSTLLLKAAMDAGLSGVHAATVQGQMIPEKETLRAAEYCRKAGIDHTVRVIDITDSADFMKNTPRRCYHCKKLIFDDLLQAARCMNIQHVIEGSHISDTEDFRPGMEALDELGIISPFIMAGLGKTDIINISRGLGLEGWDSPSGSCLATRIPYGTPVTLKVLSMISMAEEFLAELGFRQVRVRTHGALARIEVPAKDIERLAGEETRQCVTSGLKDMGFDYVAVDIEGYRQGSMNININGWEN